MKRIFSLLIFALISQFLVAQQTPGMNYQAIARSDDGQILANQKLSFRFSFTSKDQGSQPFYSEVHQVTTDAFGRINLIIGEGLEKNGDFNAIPWALHQVWLDVAMDANGGTAFELMGSTELQLVPYAFHAATASQIVDETNAIDLPLEKNQSIYWHTSGNSATRPETHFAGTRDAQNFAFKTNNKTRVVLTSGGQVKIFSGVGLGTAELDDDLQSNIANYPLTIDGSHQGIWIKVNGKRSTHNNFVTFADDENTWGEIEGQTLDELKESSEYKNQIALFTLQAVSLAASAVAFAIEVPGLYAAATASGASIFFAWQVPGWTIAAAAATTNLVIITADIVSFALEVDAWIEETINSVGVSYSSGAGDYAEWLMRSKGVRDLHYGEIVGVSGGQVSLNTTNAQHVMVVSKQPVVLGNAPQAERKHLFEKIAFMGQVPVKVVGKVEIGDYIIPSGNHDGLGVAVNPKDMKISDFSKIVGVAWQAAKEAPLNYVNVGVGLKANRLAPKVDELSAKVDNIIAYLEGREALKASAPTGTEVSTASAALAPNFPALASGKQFSDEAFDRMIDLNAPLFVKVFADAKAQLLANGYDFSIRPELNAFLDNPIPKMKELRRDPNLLTQWTMVDQKIKGNLKK